MHLIAAICLSLLAITACSPPNRVTWIPVAEIAVLSDQDGKTILTSADLPKANIVVEPDGRRVIWFQLTDDAVDRYLPRAAEHLTITLRGAKVASIAGYGKIGSFANNYLFDVPDTNLPDGKRLSDALLTRREDTE